MYINTKYSNRTAKNKNSHEQSKTKNISLNSFFFVCTGGDARADAAKETRLDAVERGNRPIDGLHLLDALLCTEERVGMDGRLDGRQIPTVKAP